jgi:hypothetical protein
MQALNDHRYLRDPAIRARRAPFLAAPLIRLCRALLRDDVAPRVASLRYAFLAGG